MKYTFSQHKGVFIYPFLVLVGLVLISACKKESELGLEVLPEDNQIGAFETDTFTVTGRTVVADSIRTDERVFMLSGMYQDHVFGTVNAKLFTQLRPEEENLNFDDREVILDSAFFTLKYNESNPFYANKEYLTNGLDLIHLYVYEILEDLELDSNYYNQSNISYSSTPIGLHAGVNPTSSTIDSVNGNNTLTFPIDTAWAGPLLRSEEIKLSSTFVNYMKGLAVVANPLTVPAGGGALFLFDPLSSSTRLHFHYRTRAKGDTAGEFVNEVFNLIIDDDTPRFNRYEIDRTGTEVEAAINDEQIGADKLYIQGLGGTYAELDCSSFLEFFKENPAVINLAEVIVPYQTGSFDEYSPPGALFFKEYDENGVDQFIIDQFESSGTHIDGLLDTDEVQYRFVVTRHIQNLILDYNNGIDNYFGFVITPTNEGVLPQRVITQGANPNSGDKIRFRIVYTPI